MEYPEIRIVDQAEAPRAASVQMAAFTADPVMRWMWPEPHAYHSHFPALVRGFGGRAFEHGSADVMAYFRGGTLSLPPSVAPDSDALEQIDEEGLHAHLESSNPANLSLYKRHGFDVIREIRAGDSPAVKPMIRVPR